MRPALNTAEYKQEVFGYAQPLNKPKKNTNPDVIRLPDLQKDSSAIPASSRKTTPNKVSSRIRTIVIKNKESLSEICAREYRDSSLAAALAEYNGITDPNRIRAGIRLRLPDRSFFGNINKPKRSTAKQKYAQYTVKKGETLSEISQKLLKTARRWQELYELNKDVIDDPDNVRAGVTLKIPKT